MSPKTPGECPDNAASLGDSEYFCREDFIGQDVVLTLAAAADGKGPIRIEEVTAPWDKKKQAKEVVCFKETVKRLALNTGNRKRLIRLMGTNKTREWVGRRVLLHYDPTVKAAKGNTPGGIVILPAEEQK